MFTGEDDETQQYDGAEYQCGGKDGGEYAKPDDDVPVSYTHLVLPMMMLTIGDMNH